MKPLITDAQRVQLLDNGAAAACGEQCDPLPVVKLFFLVVFVSWLLSVFVFDDGDAAFGLIDLGMGTPQLGHVRLSVLEGIRGPRNLAVARDPHFTPRRRLSEYARLAEADGSIND